MVNKMNLVLIGMPGSGKSSVGVILAKTLAMDFVDTDILIQNKESRTLQEIINNEGHMILREIEERTLLDIHCNNHVIATGGSAAYSSLAMQHLSTLGHIIFLKTSLETLRSRIDNYETRGLAKKPDQSFKELFEERQHLYKKYADFELETSNLTQDQVCSKICSLIGNH